MPPKKPIGHHPAAEHPTYRIAPEEPQKVRPQWEYRQAAIPSGYLPATLDELGRGGWEVFQVDIFNSVVFAKRLVAA